MRRGPLLALLRDGVPPEEVLESIWNVGAPQLQTTEGEELVMCTARYDLASPEETWAVLESQLERGAGGELIAEADVPGHGPVVRGRFSRDGRGVTIETNSVERLRALQAILREAEPGARLVEESTRPMQSLLEEMPDAPIGPAPELPQELIEQFVRQHEDRWLEDHIPALRGRTPREAAADPDLRPELEALLDDFEWTDQHNPTPLAMDVARLRHELGLA